jgi:hypothetical protein
MSEKPFDLDTLSTRLRNALQYIDDRELELLKNKQYDEFFQRMWRWPNVGKKSIIEFKIAMGLVSPEPPIPVVENVKNLELLMTSLRDLVDAQLFSRAASVTVELAAALREIARKQRQAEAEYALAQKLEPIDHRAHPMRDDAIFELVVVKGMTGREVGEAYDISSSRAIQIARREARRRKIVDADGYAKPLWQIRKAVNAREEGRP